MLRLLRVTNFAIIEQLEMELVPGFSVLTGETGAGKSIIVDALSLLLGARADAGMVRSGARLATVEGIFLLGDDLSQRINVALAEYGIDDSEQEILLAREVNLDGRNTCRVNGRIVTLTMLSSLAEHLVDIHGQNQHLSLLRVREHMDILDTYGGLWQLRAGVAESVRQLAGVRRELDGLLKDEEETAQRMDYLRFQAEEISAANLRPTEDHDLTLERDRCANAERIITLSDDAYRVLSDGSDRHESVMDLIGRVSKDLSELARLDPSLDQSRESADALTHQIEELARALRSHRDGIEHSASRLEEVEERLGLINSLKRKYGSTIEEVLTFGEKVSQELETLHHGEEHAEELKTRETQLRKQVGRLAGQLSEARQRAGRRLADAIEQEVGGLAVGHAQLLVDIRQIDSDDGVPVGTAESGPGTQPSLASTQPSLEREAASEGQSVRHLAFNGTGVDSVEFLLSLNPGEPPRPLARIASGGEASRLMLAIKTTLSAADQIPILVFDEVDAGIGGRVGNVLGEKLWSLSQGHQVLCVTHLPQVACYADRHIKVTKLASPASPAPDAPDAPNDRTVTSVEVLDGEARVTELSEMLGSNSGATRTSALEMLLQAENWKQSQGENPMQETLA